jgi:SAM-dependent methyltransferase
MDPVAAGGFASAVGPYAHARPTYARGAVGRIDEAIPAGAVLDVGAGTGILTRQLHGAGREMTAVEPLAEMLAQLTRALPRVPAVSGVAEALPFRRATFSGLTIAQALHWMDHDRVLIEVRRVVRPGGVLALVWNERDESVSWVRELTDLIEARSGGRPYPGHRDQSWDELVGQIGGFRHISTDRYPNPVASSRELVVERVRSTSFVAVMDPPSRECLISEVRDVLAQHDETRHEEQFDYPHDTVVHLWCIEGVD